ncbi:glycoside hydrolase family 5 protein [Pelomyxa schiedti]|nr:glycoside hydrolase family 5 protein [Pelomyxa schiedti]
MTFEHPNNRERTEIGWSRLDFCYPENWLSWDYGRKEINKTGKLPWLPRTDMRPTVSVVFTLLACTCVVFADGGLWEYRGMTFTGDRYCPYVNMGTDVAAQSLDHLVSTGANWVAIVATLYQYTINTTDVFPLFDPNEILDTECNYYTFVTETDDNIRTAIRYSHSIGLKVLLKPHVDLLGGGIAPCGQYWRGNIGIYFTESDWDEWFTSYGTQFLHYAQIAEEEGVEMMSMNCELITANLQEAHWRDLVQKTRQVFTGLITESANWGLSNIEIGWWDAVDIIGVDAYYPIDGTTLDEMVASWAPILDSLVPFVLKFSKSLIFTEIGYCSGNCQRSYTPNEEDYQLQATYYEAVFVATQGRDWFKGVFWWNWDTDAALPLDDSCLTPQFKPVEDVLRNYYNATQPKPSPPSYTGLCVGPGKCTC